MKTKTTTATPATAKRGHRKPVTPATPVASIGATLDRIVKIARTVTPANIIAVVTAANKNHGIVTRNVGRYTGMRVMAFQNASFVANVGWQLDDVQLLAVWVMEFPATVGRVFAINGTLGTPDNAGVRDGVSIIRGVRSDYNRTGHGVTPERKPVAVPSVSYGAKRFDIAVPVAAVVPPIASPKTATRGPRKSTLRKTA